ncbi:hypothetical protein HerbRD11066_41790 [Herbidospora sp. RD11066]
MDVPLFVPVRNSGCADALRVFRTPDGARTAVAFTSPVRLARVLGPDQHWIRLCEPALRALVTDIGVHDLVIDPQAASTQPATPQAASAQAVSAHAASAQAAGAQRATAQRATVQAASTRPTPHAA